MNGVPENLSLSNFDGATPRLIGLGQFQLDFHFDPPRYIGVEGRWEIRDGAGLLVDEAMAQSERTCYRLHRLLGRAVVASRVDAPESFALIFDDGATLTIFADPEGHESFSIQPGDVFV